jgi:hypothetical protein
MLLAATVALSVAIGSVALLATLFGGAAIENGARSTSTAPLPLIEMGTPETIPLRTQAVTSVAATPEGIWVSALSRDDPPVPLLLRLDPVTGEELDRVATGRDTVDGLVWGEGALWGLSGAGSGELIRIDSRTGAHEAVRSGVGGPIEIADGSVFVMDRGPTEGPYTLLRLDPMTGDIEASIPIPAAPWASATDGRWLWLSPVHPADRSIIRVDTSSDRVVEQVTVAKSGTVGNVVAAGDRAWVFVMDLRSSVMKIDVQAGTTQAQDVSGELTSTILAVAHGRVWLLSETGAIDAMNAATLESDPQSDAEWDVWPSSAAIDPTAALDPTTGDIWVGNYEGSVTHIPVDEVPSED